jgi:hypothetical protein
MSGDRTQEHHVDEWSAHQKGCAGASGTHQVSGSQSAQDNNPEADLAGNDHTKDHRLLRSIGYAYGCNDGK